MKRVLVLLCTVATTLTLVGCNDAAPSTSSDRGNNQDEDMVNQPQGDENGNDGLSGILGEDNGILSGVFEEEASTGMILTINGKDYDLTGHFNENIAEMIKDDLVVINPNMIPPRPYDETGYGFSETSMMDLADEEKSNCLFAKQENSPIGPATLTYYISNRYDTILEFETVNGITEDFDAKDILALDGFVPTMEAYTYYYGWNQEKGEYACAALYVDGKLVDIASYEKEAENMLEDTTLMQGFWAKVNEEEPYAQIQPMFCTDKLLQPVMMQSLGTEFPKDDPSYEQYKGMLMLLLAERDVYWDIQEGNAEYMCLITYSYLEEEFSVVYQLYGTDFTPLTEWKDHVE